MTETTFHWIAWGHIAVIALGMAAMLVLTARGKPQMTETHTDEIYHGNWWSTWHRPFESQILIPITGVCIFLTILSIVALSVWMSISPR